MKESAAVVGAGIAGRLLALKLKRAGYAVTIFDKECADSRAACSFAAAGLLTPLSEGGASSEPLMVRLGQRSLPLWQQCLPTLPLPVDLGLKGSLIVAHAPDAATLHERFTRICRRFPAASCEWVDQQRLAQLEPALQESGFQAGIYLPDEGYIQSHAALRALQLAHANEGVTAHYSTEVVHLAPNRVVTAQQTWSFDCVFDCRGFGARADLPGLRGVRGELIEVHAPEVKLTLPLQLMHQRYPIYIVPRGDDIYAVGATCVESESPGPVTVKAALELLNAVYQVHPGFRFAAIHRLVANCRPAFADNLPQVDCRPGLWRINGLYRHGFLLAPVVVDLIMRRLEGQTLGADEQALFLQGAS